MNVPRVFCEQEPIGELFKLFTLFKMLMLNGVFVNTQEATVKSRRKHTNADACIGMYI